MALSGGAVLPVRTLLCSRDVPMALTTFATLLGASAEPLSLVVHDDGSLTDDDEARLTAGLPATVLRRAEADDRMAPLLAGRPACRAYRSGPFVWGLKLLDVPLLTTGDVAYCDADILFYRRVTGLFALPTGSGAVFMADDRGTTSLAGRAWPDAPALLPWRVNAGLFALREGGYDLDFVEWFLSQPAYNALPQFSEQTCLAALGRRLGCRHYDAGQVGVVTADGDVSDLLVGHYTSPTRHRLAGDAAALGTPGGVPAVVRSTASRTATLVDVALAGLRYRAGVRRAALRRRRQERAEAPVGSPA